MSSALLMLETTAGITAARPLQKSMLHMPHALRTFGAFNWAIIRRLWASSPLNGHS
jgi:hypothetical protein